MRVGLVDEVYKRAAEAMKRSYLRRFVRREEPRNGQAPPGIGLSQ